MEKLVKALLDRREFDLVYKIINVGSITAAKDIGEEFEKTMRGVDNLLSYLKTVANNYRKGQKEDPKNKKRLKAVNTFFNKLMAISREV